VRELWRVEAWARIRTDWERAQGARQSGRDGWERKGNYMGTMFERYGSVVVERVPVVVGSERQRVEGLLFWR
jgi:hypothetical protein